MGIAGQKNVCGAKLFTESQVVFIISVVAVVCVVSVVLFPLGLVLGAISVFKAVRFGRSSGSCDPICFKLYSRARLFGFVSIIIAAVQLAFLIVLLARIQSRSVNVIEDCNKKIHVLKNEQKATDGAIEKLHIEQKMVLLLMDIDTMKNKIIDNMHMEKRDRERIEDAIRAKVREVEVLDKELKK